MILIWVACTKAYETSQIKMCLERLRQLRCGHFESYKMDHKDCKLRGGRYCVDYVQMVVRQDRDRSCRKCKALNMAALGFASPSLRNI